MIVDTDIIIRFLTNDDTQKANRFKHFLDSGEKIELTDVTVAEIFWTLKSFYKLKKNTIIPLLQSLIDHSSIKCNRSLLQKTLETLEINPISYVDSYTAAYANLNDDGRILSYDKGFEKVSEITRCEP